MPLVRMARAELTNRKCILSLFGRTLGLRTNTQDKTRVQKPVALSAAVSYVRASPQHPVESAAAETPTSLITSHI